MAASYPSKQSTWVNKLISFAGSLAGLIGATLISGKKAPEGTVAVKSLPEPVKEEVPAATAPALEPVSSSVSQKPVNPGEAPRLALISTIQPAALLPAKSTEEKPSFEEKPSGGLRIVRRANLIAFQGFELEIHTGKYHSKLDYFDTYYFSYLGEGVSEQGLQWYKFKVKDRESEKAEIRFKLAGSKFSKLIYQVVIVESFVHFLPGNSPLDEEVEEEGGE